MQALIKIICLFLISMLAAPLDVDAAVIHMDWHVAVDYTINPISFHQPVITINGMFPGPLINATTNDVIRINVFNDMDIDPLLITWHGIQQRLNSWQDGVSGTNCPILAGKNWTYEFQAKDQIGSFFYSPSINFIKAAGGYGPIRVNNRNVIAVPFPKPEAEFDLLIGDWFYTDYKFIRSAILEGTEMFQLPDAVLINGKGPFGHPVSKNYESLTVEKGKMYRLRISNLGTALSFNFRIEKHKMVVVETEGSYTAQIELDSLDVHVGQSYSVLVTADQDDNTDYYIVASPKLVNTSTYGSLESTLVARGVLHYINSKRLPSGPSPKGPDPFDQDFSINQAKSIRWNMTAGAARPNPQGTFNVSNVTVSQTFLLHGSKSNINGGPLRYVVNNVSYLDPGTPLKLADYFLNGSGVYNLDQFPTQTIKESAGYETSVVTGFHKGWLEIVFHSDSNYMDSWHLDGFGFYVVGFGYGEWSPDARSTYNLLDPVVRSTVQVYAGGWSAVYAYMDNPGMWNLRSQHLMNWYLGEELYVRIHDNDPNPAKERPPPNNLLLCGIFDQNGNVAPSSEPVPPLSAGG